MTHAERRKRRTEVVVLYKKGMTLQAIATRCRIESDYVRILLQAKGIVLPSKRQGAGDGVVAMYKKGVLLDAIAKHHKIGVPYVRMLLTDRGISLPRKPMSYLQPSDRVTDRVLKIIADLLCGDNSQSEIARKYGVTRSAISAVKVRCVGAGISIPGNHRAT